MCAQLAATSLSFSYGPNLIINKTTFTVAPGDRLGIVGPNGSGKSTLLRLLAGELEPHVGSVHQIPGDTFVVLQRQIVDQRDDLGILDWLMWRTGSAAVEAEFAAASQAVADRDPAADERYDSALNRLLKLDPATMPERILIALNDVDLSGLGDSQPVSTLSGGQRTRLQLAALRLVTADVLLLDEPTNDLDATGLAYLEEILNQRSGPTVVVSHDRAFLSAFVTGILELDGHDHSTRRYGGGFDAWQEQRAATQRRAAEAFEEWSHTASNLRQRAHRERLWSQKGVVAAKKSDEPDRSIRSMRMEAGENLAGKAAQTDRALERHERNRVEQPWQAWELNLSFNSVANAGAEVARLDGATVERGNFLLGPIDVVLASGDRVLLRGPNGGGKTTLLEALFGELPLLSGNGGVGPGTVVGTMTQGRDVFGDSTLLDAFIERSGLDMPDSRSQLAKLGLTTEHIARSAQELSPGEQTRAILGLFAALGVNTLVLDEPTNHLDLEAIEQLEVGLAQFKGTVLLITHDRRMAEQFDITREWVLAKGILTEN
jgi:ATPase subunit of ABC transporter with duplicated ATPase domains